MEMAGWEVGGTAKSMVPGSDSAFIPGIRRGPVIADLSTGATGYNGCLKSLCGGCSEVG
jgi:hypothetical protein